MFAHIDDESSPNNPEPLISDANDETLTIHTVPEISKSRPVLHVSNMITVPKIDAMTNNEILSIPLLVPAEPSVTKSMPASALGHRKKHSRGHSVTKIEIQVDLKDNSPSITVNNAFDKEAPIETSGKLASSSFGNVNIRNTTPDVLEMPTSLCRPQSAGGRLHVDTSHGTTVYTKPSTLAVVHTAAIAKENVTKETTSRKISGPPKSLLNLFEPLPSAVSPPKLTIETTPQQRPMSMIVSSNSELPSTISGSSNIVPSATISESLSSMGMFPAHVHVEDALTSANVSIKSNVLNEQSEDEEAMEIEDDIEKDMQVPQELDIKKEEVMGSEIKELDSQGQSPKQESLNSRSHNTSLSSDGSDRVSIFRVPSHPDLRLRPHLAKVDSLDSSPIMRARSVSQLQNEIDGDSGSFKRRAYSGSRDTVPGFAGLVNLHIRQSLDKLRAKGTTTALPLTSRLPLSHQNSPNKGEKERISRRVSADPDRERDRVLSAGSKGRGRPKSMIETGSFVHYRNPSMDLTYSASQDFLSQLFWTSVSLLESDYENEYFLAQHLFGKVISQFDLMSDSTYTRLEMMLQKTKLEKFSGVHRLLLKGLTLESTTKSTRELLSKICPHANRSIFDPSNFKGLPLNIVALLPELVLHFEKPNNNSKDIAETVAKVSTKFIS